jgi:hypothetical protein
VSWEFCTEPDFEAKLEWTRAFVREEDGAAADVVRLLADLADAPPDDVVHPARLDAGALGEHPEHVRRQVHGVDSAEGTVALANGRAHRADDHGISDHASFLSQSLS